MSEEDFQSGNAVTADQRVLFVEASNAFKSVFVETFAAAEAANIDENDRRPELGDITNRHTDSSKDSKDSPIAKRHRSKLLDMDNLIRQTAKGSHGGNVPSSPALQDALGKAPRKPPDPNILSTDGQSSSQQGPVRILNRANNGVLPKPTADPNMATDAKAKTGSLKTSSYASKAAGNEPRTLRPPDTRSRNFEAWKQARDRRNRALCAAARSQECIDKNRARFDRLNSVTGNAQRYPELDDEVAMTEHTIEEIRTTFEFLRQTQPKPTGKVVKTTIDTRQLAFRLDFLKKKTFVLYTVDVSPSRDAVIEWAETILHQQMGIGVTRVRVLNKHCYLITVETEEDRDWILDATPLYLGPHMVFALPWDPAFDSSNLESARVPVWVELPNIIHPSMEAFGAQLLKAVGEVLFTSYEEGDCHYTSIKGCLRMDLSGELPEAIEVSDPITEEAYLQPIIYKSLPNACFSCHQRDGEADVSDREMEMEVPNKDNPGGTSKTPSVPQHGEAVNPAITSADKRKREQLNKNPQQETPDTATHHTTNDGDENAMGSGNPQTDLQSGFSKVPRRLVGGKGQKAASKSIR
ncbi:hypothetical protein R1sor_007255 [Riccia sorocarpa]|uniref:DUF4283 domain-containing protein n=1 Tax=Riccia sorocarpa TaxID=122646 RepID=A0ABD3HW86_9MARC